MSFLRSRPHRLFAPHLAGWLFADVLLVLLLVVLASVPATEGPQVPETGASPSPSPSANPSPTPTRPPTLDREHPLIFELAVNYDILSSTPSANDLVRRFREELVRRGVENKRAGFMLAFGFAPTPGYHDRIAVKVATKITELIRTDVQQFDDMTPRPFWTEGSPGRVRFEIYFFFE